LGANCRTSVFHVGVTGYRGSTGGSGVTEGHPIRLEDSSTRGAWFEEAWPQILSTPDPDNMDAAAIDAARVITSRLVNFSPMGPPRIDEHLRRIMVAPAQLGQSDLHGLVNTTGARANSVSASAPPA
jgi:hypothetical protein